MKVLVTGGMGYIGSHTCVELLNKGYSVVIVDNLSNSNEEVINRLEKITGKRPVFYNADLRYEKELYNVFEKENVDSVMHFAALKSIPESVKFPIEYYENNVTGTLNVCRAMKKYSVKKIVLSSSAAVYGLTENKPIKEDGFLFPCNPYGRTKLIQEQIVSDYAASENTGAVILRYFNPIGAHKSGLIGENPNGEPSNLMPYISQVAAGRLKELSIFGNNYNTIDGTGVRDYIHVSDLAEGHINALEKLNHSPKTILTCNLGSGHGYSVLQVVNSFEKATGVKINYRFASRRSGDVDMCYADTSLAEKELGWTAKRKIDEMCRDEWNWQKKNPKGY